MTDDRAAKKLDDAARAAWLSFVAGRTQDEIARLMGVSRQSAQRLVSQAVASGLVKVRIDHPISRCLDLAHALGDTFGLRECEVVPALGANEDTRRAVSFAVGDRIEALLSRPDPMVLGLGTGRTLRIAVEHLPRLDCAQHRIVSLTGNIAPDGSTAYYNVLFTMTEKVTAQTYPLPVPVIAASEDERAALTGQAMLANTRALAAAADMWVVGVGVMTDTAPVLQDGFIGAEDLARLRGKGAVAEILGWPLAADGTLVADPVTARVCSAPLDPAGNRVVLAAAHGPEKVAGLSAALRGGLVNGLVTDEDTATALLGR
ncbi:sugar-binding transcriptional regulator [Roseivivax isoporae]|uniref:DeoR family transcriptional regulator n=1 Tax=Roseivivax isoporae LMG 25204 TaxID=1449351 RepID=X7FCG3_9RHOB|nr:sugar-binding domain-containing protein [Roseivivax isoporae]ETX29796.1 DeoR family transcriptional regulator [Roseivivax isoporae LMG 25204]